jgi:hypothetical protein
MGKGVQRHGPRLATGGKGGNEECTLAANGYAATTLAESALLVPRAPGLRQGKGWRQLSNNPLAGQVCRHSQFMRRLFLAP